MRQLLAILVAVMLAMPIEAKPPVVPSGSNLVKEYVDVASKSVQLASLAQFVLIVAITSGIGYKVTRWWNGKNN